MTTIQWRAVRQPNGTTDTDLYDLRPLSDAYKQFASSALASFLDPNASKASNYPRGQRVELQYSTDGGSTWSTRFAGTVLETTRTMRDNLPQLDVDIVGYDHLLKRRRVYKTYSSTTLSSILEDVIKQFTAVTWDATAVTVQNDKTITREFLGVKVDEVVRYIASESADEEFGVDNNLTFFFRQQDIQRADPLGDADIISHDLPDNGKRSINRFKLFYGPSGSRASVVVEDREAQRSLKDKLGTSSRVVLSDSDTIPEITDETRAKNIAEQRLGERSELLTGTITTFERFSTSPGDVFSLTRSAVGIDDEDFRVAQVDHYWQRGETEVTIAEQRGNIDDILVGLSDSVQNDRARDADPDATETTFLDLSSGVDVTTTTTITQDTLASDAFVPGVDRSKLGFKQSDVLGFRMSTRSTTSESKAVTTAAGLDRFRDAWQGESLATLSHVAVGTDNSDPTRADTSLTEADRTATTDHATGTTTVTYGDAVFPAGGGLTGADITEVGVFDAASGGNLYTRATLDAVSHASDTVTAVDVAVSVADDGDLPGVITDTGQERLRDLYLKETGHAPSDMLLGTGTTDASTSDSSLGTKIIEKAIDSTADRSTGITDVIMRLGSGEANGNDLAEVGEENSSDELLTRLVFEPFSKTSNDILETNHRFEASNV
jgi:hypothetical protein